MKHIIFLIVLVALCGCQTTRGRMPAARGMTDVTFVSFPPGAVIEVDGEYKGRTPSILQFREYHLEHERYAQYYKIFIYPHQEGYCIQKLALNPYEVPEKLIFDLSDCGGETSGVPILPNGNVGEHPDTPTY